MNKLHDQQLKWVFCIEAASNAAMDGARSMVEWTAARLDVTHSTARRLLQARRAGQPPEPALDAFREAFPCRQ